MKIDTGKAIINLKGEDYTSDGKNLTVGHVLAEALAASDMGGKMKLFLLAQKCYAAESVEMDEVDLSLTKKAVEVCKSYNNIIIGQTLLALEAAV